MDSVGDSKRVLARLLRDPDGLPRLEAITSQFNLFEATGARDRETRHSDFLGFLLDPSESHGLGDAVLRRFLRAVADKQAGSIGTDFSFRVEVSDLDEVLIYRERQSLEGNDRMDILLVHRQDKYAVIVENKIWTEDHGGQIGKYYESARAEFRDHDVFGVYLTPDASSPNEGHHAYVSLGYATIAQLLEEVLKTRLNSMGAEVRIAIEHYVLLIRNFIMPNNEIDRLCEEIWRKHGTALKTLMDHAPDFRGGLVPIAQDVLAGTPSVLVDLASTNAITFYPRSWMELPLRDGHGWTDSKMVILCQVRFTKSEAYLQVYIGPGKEETRIKLFEGLRGKRPFKIAKTLTPTWRLVYQKHLLTIDTTAERSFEELKEELSQELRQWLEGDFKSIETEVKGVFIQ